MSNVAIRFRKQIDRYDSEYKDDPNMLPDRYLVTYVAIMQAEAAERQAAALERIAAVLESLVSAAGNLKVEQP